MRLRATVLRGYMYLLKVSLIGTQDHLLMLYLMYEIGRRNLLLKTTTEYTTRQEYKRTF